MLPETGRFAANPCRLPHLGSPKRSWQKVRCQRRFSRRGTCPSSASPSSRQWWPPRWHGRLGHCQHMCHLFLVFLAPQPATSRRGLPTTLVGAETPLGLNLCWRPCTRRPVAEPLALGRKTCGGTNRKPETRARYATSQAPSAGACSG